jgi:site-specific DNA-methyltransferase (adenine-specific)
MEGMAHFPDKYFDLAIVDPPYGIKADRSFVRKTPAIDPRNGRPIITKPKKTGKWDNERPTSEYFKELQRVSINQIIWGGNYFADLLSPHSCWLVWDKVNGETDQADCELAWTSFNTAVRLIRYMWCIAQGKNTAEGHIAQGNNKLWEKKYHPTQKPVALYKWLLKNYAKPDFKIIDTHAGSCSSVIAFLEFGCEWIAFELDKDYFEAASKRIEIHKAQLKLF